MPMLINYGRWVDCEFLPLWVLADLLTGHEPPAPVYLKIKANDLEEAGRYSSWRIGTRQPQDRIVERALECLENGTLSATFDAPVDPYVSINRTPWFEPSVFVQWAVDQRFDVPAGLVAACKLEEPQSEPGPPRCTIRKAGAAYEVSFRGQSTISMLDGFYYLAHLIQNPDRFFRPETLYAALKNPGGSPMIKEHAQQEVDGEDDLVKLTRRSIADEKLSPEVRAQYKVQLKRLTRQLDVAHARDDEDHVHTARLEIAALQQELTGSRGPRNLFVGERKKVRDRVNKAIARAIEVLKKERGHLKRIATHLKKCWQRGQDLAYRPGCDPDNSIAWSILLS